MHGCKDGAQLHADFDYRDDSIIINYINCTNNSYSSLSSCNIDVDDTSTCDINGDAYLQCRRCKGIE